MRSKRKRREKFPDFTKRALDEPPPVNLATLARTARSRLGVGNDLLLWQLVDSAFPTGGFAHSGGLEAAWQHGEVRTRDEFAAFLEIALEQAEHNALPLVLAAHAEPERLPEFDRLCDAFLTNHVANRASRTQGRAFLFAVERVFKAGCAANLPCAHFAPVFGAALRQLSISAETAARLLLFSQLRSLIAAGVRLNIVGPLEGQAIQFRMASSIETICEQSASSTLDALAQTAPLLEIWQGAQDRLYSRLFQS